eukprot:5916831-Amphidinium_carterae.1
MLEDSMCLWQEEGDEQYEPYTPNPYLADNVELLTWHQNTLGESDEVLVIPATYSTGLLEEDDAVAVFATFSAVRSALHSQQLARGYFASPTAADASWRKGKGKDFGKVKKGGGAARSTLRDLIASTRCARCGQIGHWARSCPENRNPTSAQPAATSATAAGSPRTFYQSNNIDQEGARNAEYYPSSANRTCWMMQTDARVFNVPRSWCNLELESRYGLVDTGAEDAVIGELSLPVLARALQKCGRQLAPIE